ncbi:MAG: hypothetical protein H6641_24440 [Caldilineaceae bacterium]|nr:hypothetical protein [Caldilineaceae bacterium]
MFQLNPWHYPRRWTLSLQDLLSVVSLAAAACAGARHPPQKPLPSLASGLQLAP